VVIFVGFEGDAVCQLKKSMWD